jgi:sec-independent protein translocase protein TatB
VLGPEKLPRVVAELGRWVGRARAMARQFREQLEEEVELEAARKAQAGRPTHSDPPIAGAPPAGADATAAAAHSPEPPTPNYPHAQPADATGANDEQRT